LQQGVVEIKLSNFDPPSKRLCRAYRSLQRAVGPVPPPNKIGKNHGKIWDAYISTLEVVWSDLNIRCPRNKGNGETWPCVTCFIYPQGDCGCISW